MDAGKFYAFLRFEEASLALRTVLHLGLIDQLGKQTVSHDELRETLGWTEQSARTMFALLQVMEILEHDAGHYRVTELAANCLGDGIPTSRKPYLAMGSGDDVDGLLQVLRGDFADDALPLYGEENAGETVMDHVDVAREIAFGLASRARNFAAPLAAAVAQVAPGAKTLADIGAGSPYVAHACLQALPQLQTVCLVDRANGMQFVHEMIDQQQLDTGQLDFHEGDFFAALPAAEIYVLSNTAHDWKPEEYTRIADNIRKVMDPNGLVCIHEPLLLTSWNSDAEWMRALWMACYALTLLRLTLGQGTCYTVDEHHAILAKSGFQPTATPLPTTDGCTALFYRPEN